MNTAAERSNDFLLELYNQTEGDTEKQVSMHDIGEVIGLEKTEASMLAEDLIMDQLVELKTLSGGIGITAKGLDALQKTGVVQGASAGGYQLSRESKATAEDKDAVNALIKEIQTSKQLAGSPYENLEELIIDVKTLEVHLLSPNPKTAVIRELLRSLNECLRKNNITSVADQIATMIEV